MDIPNPLGGNKFRPYVKAIIDAERAPIRQLETRKAKEGERLKLLQEFSGRVKKLTDGVREVDGFRKFRELKTDLGDNGNLLGIDIDKNIAEPGEYDLEIIQLAGSHSIISDGYESADAEIGVGYFYYELPDGEVKSVYLDSEHNTLKTLVDRINREKDLDLQAMIVNDGSGGDEPWRLIIKGKKTGMDQQMTFPEFYFVDGDVSFSIDDERLAQSAIVKLNGFEVLTPENKIADLIPGVALTLKQAKEGHEFTLSITEDVGKIAGKLKATVDNINAVLEFINKQNQMDEKTDTSKTLGGDGMLRTIELQLRSLMQRPIALYPSNDEEADPVFVRASDMGIRFERTGLLSLNQEQLQKKLVENFSMVSDFFIESNGLLPQLSKLTDSLVGLGNGMVVQRERGFRDKMKQMDDQIAQKENQIAKKEEALKNKFANLESTIQKLQGQQSYMMQALGSAGGGAPG